MNKIILLGFMLLSLTFAACSDASEDTGSFAASAPDSATRAEASPGEQAEETAPAGDSALLKEDTALGDAVDTEFAYDGARAPDINFGDTRNNQWIGYVNGRVPNEGGLDTTGYCVAFDERNPTWGLRCWNRARTTPVALCVVAQLNMDQCEPAVKSDFNPINPDWYCCDSWMSILYNK